MDTSGRLSEANAEQVKQPLSFRPVSGSTLANSASLKNRAALENRAPAHDDEATPNEASAKANRDVSKKAPPSVSQGQLLLKTKLFAPRFRPELVSRPRLIKKISNGSDRKLTLVAAPAGFGKTVLLSDWARQSKKPVAWLSLDEHDNDLTRVCSYLAAAVQTLDGKRGHPYGSVGPVSRPANMERVLTALVNDIEARNEDMALVLDDYHLIETPPVHDAVAFLIEHLPPHVHLIIASRSDADLPIGRLRARGQLAEIAASDLRFTSGETSTFLQVATGQTFSDGDVATLEHQTEGWAAGLQLASLALQGETDVDELTQAFTGHHRYVDRYLTEEVFRRQPEDVQEFLLHTCILDRLSAPLCDAVTGQSRSRSLLKWLETSGLFLTALDNEQHWYRYHHLFRDFLQNRLHSQAPELKAQLHRRACRWFDQEGLLEEAITHALAARDHERAADLIERDAEVLLKRGEVFTLQSWLDGLPDTLVHRRPRLGLLHAWVLILTGQLDAVEPRVWDVECELRRHIDQPAPLPTESLPTSSGGEAPAEIVETFGESEILGKVAAIRGTLARLSGDTDQSLSLCQKALTLLPEKNLVWRGISLLGLGAAHGLRGELDRARQALREARSTSQTSDDVHIGCSALRRIAYLQKMQGQLHKALHTYRQTLQLISEHNLSSVPGAGYAHTGLGDLFYEWNDLEAAAHHFDRGLEEGQQYGTVGMLVYAHRGRARLRQAQGRPEAAMEELQEAKRLAQRYSYGVAQMGPWETRLRIAQDDLDAARRWIQQYTPSTDDPSSYLREFKLLTLARAHLALEATDEALPPLEKTLRAAQKTGRAPSVIEALLLQALAYRQQGRSGKSRGALKRALSLAKSEQYRRIFLDEGLAMGELLQETLPTFSTSSTPEDEELARYVSELVEAFMEETALSGDGAMTGDASLVEPLSKREMEVLRLIARGLKNKEIAEELFIATSTVKWHNKNIYAKLDAQNRTQAVKSARTLQLLS